jgi:KDO2-lipid IV(A) lauroyltransferase
MNQKKKNKKRKQRNLPLDYTGYLALRLLIAFLRLFTIQRNLKSAAWLGRLLYKHYHRGRKRALENLTKSFPDKSPQWIDATAKRSFEQLAMLAMDVLCMSRIVTKDWRSYLECKNIEHVKWMLKENRTILMVTAHYGNFEIMGYIIGLFGFPIFSIARPLDNRFISKYLYSIREKHSQKIIDKKGATRLIPQLVNQGGAIAFIADQDAGRKGLFVDFFGRKASTYKSIGLIAITENVPIVVGYSRRIENQFKFEIAVNRIIWPEEWNDKDDPLKWVTQEYTREIENFIRQDPTQYWWLHRRWKHRPKEELKAANNCS